jgi:hypothetical protein
MHVLNEETYEATIFLMPLLPLTSYDATDNEGKPANSGLMRKKEKIIYLDAEPLFK